MSLLACANAWTELLRDWGAGLFWLCLFLIWALQARWERNED